MSTDINKHAQKVTIKIPRILYDRLTDIVEGSGFNSVTEFIVYVLRDLASSHTVPNSNEQSALNKDEIDAIRKRLKSLGYF
jgi:hypothetical protein